MAESLRNEGNLDFQEVTRGQVQREVSLVIVVDGEFGRGSKNFVENDAGFRVFV